MRVVAAAATGSVGLNRRIRPIADMRRRKSPRVRTGCARSRRGVDDLPVDPAGLGARHEAALGARHERDDAGDVVGLAETAEGERIRQAINMFLGPAGQEQFRRDRPGAEFWRLAMEGVARKTDHAEEPRQALPNTRNWCTFSVASGDIGQISAQDSLGMRSKLIPGLREAARRKLEAQNELP